MPSKIRPIFQHGGRWFSGGQAQYMLNHYLTQYNGKSQLTRPRNVSFKRLQKMYEELVTIRPTGSDSLWIFRERKNIEKGKSRFKFLSGYLGIGKVIPRGGTKKKNSFLRDYEVLREQLTAIFPPQRNNEGRIPGAAP